MGTPEFATTSLRSLISAGFNVVGVITAPDRPAGRGRKMQSSDVKQYALLKGLPVLQPTNLKSEQFLNELSALKADLQIVVAFRMLPKAVWSMPEQGTFNLHASLLPAYRGAAPINWAIINGETQTGVTTFYIDEKIDTGEIILQKKTTITREDSAGSLHDKLMHLGANLIKQTVELIEKGQVVTSPQLNNGVLKPAPKLDKATCQIDWSAPILEIYNKIRGLSPYPAAWANFKNGEQQYALKIYTASMQMAKHSNKIGSVTIYEKTLRVAVENGFIDLLEIQLPGKRKMRTEHLLHGFELTENAIFTS